VQNRESSPVKTSCVTQPNIMYQAIEKIKQNCLKNVMHFMFKCELYSVHFALNPLDSKGSYNTTSNNTKLVHWPMMGGLLHLVQRGGAWTGCGLAQSPRRYTKCNSPPINGQCTNLCIAIWWSVAVHSFNVAIKWLIRATTGELLFLVVCVCNLLRFLMCILNVCLLTKLREQRVVIIFFQ